MSFQRVEPDDVRAIFPSSQDLQPFIATATLLVTERLVGHYSDARLREIERWLAAHLASTSGSSPASSGQVSEVRAEEISVKYATDTLDSSRFGEQVALLDYKGILKSDMQSTIAHFSVH